ncbi:RuvA C-terminal domain-containing protein [Chloroflexota bacterium]
MYDCFNYRAAIQEYSRYLTTTNNMLADFRKNLLASNKPRLPYPKWLDAYQVNQWFELPLPEKQQVEQWAQPLVLKKVPRILHELMAVDISFKTRFVPYVQYEVQEIPCLDWWFKTFILAEANINTKAKTVTKTFYGCDFNSQMSISGLLGKVYLEPCLWERTLGIVIPLVLLLMVARGEMERSGIQVIERKPPLTTFEIQGFDEEVTLHDDFLRFIKDITKNHSLPQALLSRQLIDTGTFHLLETKIGILSEEGGMVKGAGELYLVEKAVEKLVSMGWTEKDAEEAVKKEALHQAVSVEALVKSILKSESG